MSDAKGKIRKGTLLNRKLLGKEEWQKRVDLVNDAVFQLIENRKLKKIHVFLPIEKNKELNTWDLVRRLFDHGVSVCISISDFKTYRMTHYQYHPDVDFVLNRFDIPEPKNAARADISDLEMILIPLLAADKEGARIGYGKGFYDRLLADLPQSLLKVGVNLAPLFDRFGFEAPHDISLDICITPFKTYHFHD